LNTAIHKGCALTRHFHSAAFLSGLLKDIKSERPKITEKDNLRLLFVTKWFLEFFLTSRTRSLSNTNSDGAEGTSWGFGLIAEVIERGWIVWVLKRMREAVEEKVRVSLIPRPLLSLLRLSHVPP